MQCPQRPEGTEATLPEAGVRHTCTQTQSEDIFADHSDGLPLHSCIVFHLRDDVSFNSSLVNIHFYKHPRDEILRAKNTHQSFDCIEFSSRGTL